MVTQFVLGHMTITFSVGSTKKKIFIYMRVFEGPHKKWNCTLNEQTLWLIGLNIKILYETALLVYHHLFKKLWPSYNTHYVCIKLFLLLKTWNESVYRLSESFVNRTRSRFIKGNHCIQPVETQKKAVLYIILILSRRNIHLLKCMCNKSDQLWCKWFLKVDLFIEAETLASTD